MATQSITIVVTNCLTFRSWEWNNPQAIITYLTLVKAIISLMVILNLKRNHWVIDEKWDNWFQQRFITEHQLRLPCFLVIDTCRCKRRFWRTMTDKILKEEMPNVNIGYQHEKRLVFWCKAYSRKIVWGHCHEKEISKQAKEVDPKKISWQLCLCH